jgi:threonylcarbamoyladenosine tRNA methylthiotransferase CDKAL1
MWHMFVQPKHIHMTTEDEALGRPTKVYLETYGCAFNVSDSEVMAGLLGRDGFEIVNDPGNADAAIINSCTVKDRTFRELEKRLASFSVQPDANAPGPCPVVILAGCAPRVPAQSEYFSKFSQIGPDNLSDISEVVRRSLRGERVTRLERVHDKERLQLPLRRRNPAIEIFPISKGCLGSCTFCQTVLARGRLRSFPEEQILGRIQEAVASGISQIWLTSQDCGAYGLDCGTNLPRLMRRIAKIPGDFLVRVGMANPDLIKLFLPEFVEALAHERFYHFAHIPVQAGSDNVLRDMRRQYTASDFLQICDKLRHRIPAITLATDIIAGFPTEAPADFEQTLSILRQAAVPVVNRSKFSPRPGTSAARLRQLSHRDVAARSKALLDVATETSRTDLGAWIGKTVTGVVEENPRRGVSVARTQHYRPIVIDREFPSGTRVVAQVTAADRFHLCGNLAAGPGN